MVVAAVIRLACANCGRRFEVTELVYRRCFGVVECPACGSLDLRTAGGRAR